MRWLVTVVVIAIIAFVGYRYFYTGEGQQVAEQAAQQVEETTEEAAQAVGQAAEEATEAVEGATEEAADTADEAVQSTEQTAEQATESAEEAAESTEQSAQDATAALRVDGVNLGEQIGTTVSDTVGALEGITDRASAEAALPDLEAVEGKLDELSGRIEQLPQQGKEALASLLDDSLPELQDLVNKIEGMEGVGEVVKPTLDGIMTKLEAWGKQPA
jgi:F0F1-type ATP synthase membrane subunit b/b'